MKCLRDKNIIPVCPEQLGGLTTPRLPAEIKDGGGQDVLDGLARVVDKEGTDVTDQFIKGAYETLKLARLLGARKAILKEKSPSCGPGKIYDGNFKGNLIDGSGVTAALLRSNGIEVSSEEDFLKKDRLEED